MLAAPLNGMGSWLPSMFKLHESLSLNDVENPNMWRTHVGAEMAKENDSGNENDQSEEWMEKPFYS